MARARKQREELTIAPPQARKEAPPLWDRTLKNSLGLVVNNDVPQAEDSPAKAALRRAVGCFMSHRYKDALAACAEAIDLEPDWHEPHVWDGLSSSVCGSPADAIAAYAVALSLTPIEHPGRWLLFDFQVQAFLRLRLIDDALSNCAAGEAVYPGEGILKRARAKIERFDRRYRLRITPTMMAESYYKLGNAFGRRSLLSIAAIAFRKALEADPALDARYNITRLIEITECELAEYTQDKDVSESNSSDYDRFMHDMAPELAVVQKHNMPSVAALLEAINLWKATKAQITTSETPARAKAKPRLKWDKDRLPDESPAAFAWRAYQAEAKAGTLHRGVIAQEDKPLAVKLASWLRSHPMPSGIDIPTKPEWNTRQLESLPALRAASDVREALRLDAVSRMRRREQRSAFG